MDIAYRGEIVTPSRCGRLDQAAAFGSTLVALKFDGARLDAAPLTLHEPLCLLVVDLKSTPVLFDGRLMVVQRAKTPSRFSRISTPAIPCPRMPRTVVCIGCLVR